MNLFAISSILPFFLIITTYYFVTLKVLNYYPNHFVSPSLRFPAITGIRSLLAFGVFFHHAIMYYFYYQTGRLEAPPSIFYSLLGEISVAIFFSITSFLFWTKAIENKGHIPFLNFLFLRIKRLAPAYILSALLILVLVAFASKFVLASSVSKLLRDIIFFVFGLGSIHVSTINSIDTGMLGSGIFWTLRYEWKFYLILPIAAVVLRKKLYRNFFWFLIICFIALKLTKNHESLPHGLLFLPGILAAHLSKYKDSIGLVWRKFLMIIGVFSLGAIFIFNNTIYTFASFFLLTFFFISIFFWPTSSILFRLFKSKAAIFFGTISYSIYLLHLIVLYTSLTLLNFWFPVASLTDFFYWFFIFFTGILLLIFSSISYRYIELPFLKHY